MKFLRNERTGKIDGELVLLVIMVSFIGIAVLTAVYFAVDYEIKRSKLPEIRHYITQLEDRVNIEIWRKDNLYLNDTIIIVDKDRIRIKSIGSELEISVEGEIISHEIKPIFRVVEGFLGGATLTNKVSRYVVSLHLRASKD